MASGATISRQTMLELLLRHAPDSGRTVDMRAPAVATTSPDLRGARHLEAQLDALYREITAHPG